jgi:hypothetical protein
MKDLADWSSLPRDLYVISVKSNGIGYDVQCCSVPMMTVPEVRYTLANAVVQQTIASTSTDFLEKLREWVRDNPEANAGDHAGEELLELVRSIR